MSSEEERRLELFKVNETLTYKFYQMPKVPLLKTKTNTYSVSEQKDKNRHEPSKQFGPKLQ